MIKPELIESGEVWLVGAGPGDPDLLTRRAERLIRSASVIFHDALVGPGVLDLAVPGTRIVPVGKRSGRHSKDQKTIDALIVEAALAGERVGRRPCAHPRRGRLPAQGGMPNRDKDPFQVLWNTRKTWRLLKCRARALPAVLDVPIAEGVNPACSQAARRMISGAKRCRLKEMRCVSAVAETEAILPWLDVTMRHADAPLACYRRPTLPLAPGAGPGVQATCGTGPL